MSRNQPGAGLEHLAFQQGGIQRRLVAENRPDEFAVRHDALQGRIRFGTGATQMLCRERGS